MSSLTPSCSDSYAIVPPPTPPLRDRVYGEEDGWKRQNDAIWQIKLKAEGKLEIVWVSSAGSIPELSARVYF